MKNTVMLTGDSKKIADHIGKQVGVDKIYSELLPGLVSLLKIEYDYIWITNFYHKGENE
ncbi:hypothetical protein EfmAA818_18750 [Enterococcus faecium]|nr:hypothetical protein EfmAA818_18750 [Enterococcus faecium]